MLNNSYKTHVLGRVRSTVFEPALLITKLNWYPCKRRHSRWKLSQELKLNFFVPDYTHAKMTGRKRERYKIEPRISLLFMLELEYESKIIKKLLVIKEICSWLPLGLDGRKVCSQEHFNSWLSFQRLCRFLQGYQFNFVMGNACSNTVLLTLPSTCVL